MYPPGDVSKSYSDAFFSIVNEDDELPDVLKTHTRWGIKFMIDNLAVAKEVDDLAHENEATLSRLGQRLMASLVKSYAIEELVPGAKHYVIAWSTTKDLMAKLISTSFDLGIQDKDLSFGMMLRNTKVAKTQVPSICKAHASKVEVSGSDRRRNEAVLRGKLLDEEINDFQTTYAKLFGRRYSLLNPEPMSEDDFKKRLSELNSKLPSLVSQKQSELRAHFAGSMKLNMELSRGLGRFAGLALKNEKIE